MNTPLEQDERAAGAKFAERNGCALAESFAGFETEYAAARDAVALFDTSWHASYALTGPDRVRYLNAIVSNNVQTLEEGRGLPALLLSPQGRILAELEIFRRLEELFVRTHASLRQRTRETLEKYIIMDDVELNDVTDERASFAIEGPRAAAIVEQACGVKLGTLPALAIRDVHIEAAFCQLVAKSHFGQPGAEFIGATGAIRSLWPKMLEAVLAHDGAPIGMAALDALRLEAGMPWFPADFNDTVIPHEAVLENSHVSFAKGCYTGQEIVERVRSRGQVNRRRVRLKFSSAAPPATATRLLADGKEIGLVTSSAYSPAAKTSIGMGYVRREYSAPGSALQWEGGTAQVI